MMRSLLLTVLLALGGCAFGLRGGDVYQARGVTLALEMRGAGVIAGELLTVESGAFVIDAVDEVARPTRVIRVPMTSVLRGVVLGGTPSPGEIRDVRRTPPGLERLDRLSENGNARRITLPPLSRFPYGIPDAARDRLLTARGQTQVDGLDRAPARMTPLR